MLKCRADQILRPNKTNVIRIPKSRIVIPDVTGCHPLQVSGLQVTGGVDAPCSGIQPLQVSGLQVTTERNYDVTGIDWVDPSLYVEEVSPGLCSIEIGGTQEEASEVGTRSGTKEVMQRQRHPRGIFGMKRPPRWRDRLLVSGRQEVVPFCITSHWVDIEERLMDNTKDGYTTLPDHSKIISCYEDGF